MEYFFYVFARVVSIGLSALSLAMVLRVILQFFASEDNKFVIFCYAVTEPFIIPIRVIMEKLNIGQSSPIDIPFFIAYIIIMLLQMLLPIV
ncbi:MAG: YggT family protein [Clostridia bacterium]|nr:YggT family protein [Clostridia bacterium]MBR3680480.1 YggT family protein [Clostridia bacterium]